MHATVLVVCLVVVYGFFLGSPGVLDRSGNLKGPDFLQFFVSGRAVLQGQPQVLYDPDAHYALALRLVPDAAAIRYFPVYPPHVALLFAPFAAVGYLPALALWSLVTVALYAACCCVFLRACPALVPYRVTVAVAAAGFPAFFNVVTHGQNSVLALAAFTAAFAALNNGRRFLAGVSIGLLLYKPQLGLAAACTLVLCGEWRMVTGAVTSVVGQVAATWALLGSDVVVAYTRVVARFGEMSAVLDVKPYQMHSLRAFWELLIPSHSAASVAYVATSCAVVLGTCVVWRSCAAASVRYSALLLATALINPHLYVYDLVVIGPALLLLTDWTVQHAHASATVTVQRMLYFAYALPLAGSVAAFTHIQFSVVAIGALLAIVTLTVRRAPAAAAVAAA
jgi:hypothetical protein